MNSNDLFDIIGETPERYVLDAANAKVITMQKRPQKRMWLIAAIIALILCLVGCAVAYVLSLDSMILGTEFMENRTGETEPRTRLSLQGYVGSPSYQAAKEWFDFLQTYDPDGAIEFSDEADNVEFPEDYQFYHLYSVEMKEKLDEICQKYNLELLGPMIVDTTTENMFHELGINGVLREGAQAEVEWSTGSPGYFFRNGTFDVEFGVTLTGENNPWPYENVVFFRCRNKSSFDAVFLSMADPTQFEEWNYTTSAGVEVLLVMGPDGALIVADIGDYFITVGGIETKAGKVYCYYRMSGTTGEMVEYLRYDAERNPQNPWFRSTDATGQDISLEPISKTEFDRIHKSYAPIELDWKPVAEYPLS